MQKYNGQDGSGLIETIILSGVLFALVQHMFQYQMNATRVSKINSIRASVAILKKHILGKMDCGETIWNIDPNWQECQLGQQLEVYSNDSSKSVLIAGSAPYTLIENFQVRAVCRHCDNCWRAKSEISFEYRLVDSAQKVKKHLLYNDDRWTKVFKDGELHCQFLH